MLRGDPELPFLEMAWSSRKTAGFFRDSVLPRVCPGQDVTGVEIDDMKYTPGRKCVILYSLRFAGQSRNPSKWAVVTFAKDDGLQEIYTRHYGGDTEPSGESPRPAVLVPQYRCLVEFFPMDWRLPSLAWATDLREVGVLLPHVMAGGGSTLPCTFVDVQVLRYRLHHRCVLRYVVESRERKGPKEVVGKVYPQGPKPAQVWKALDRLHPQGTACGVIIPKPLGVMNGWNLLLMERVSGTCMKQVLEEARAQGEAKEATGLAAAALATLHSLRFESQEVRSLESELEKLRKRAARLHLVAPLLARQVDALLHQVASLAVHFPAGALSLIHGDYGPSQLLLDEGQVAMVDFDRACLGDAAIDVGNFMAVLHKEAVVTGQDQLRQLSTYFLTEYQARRFGKGLVDRARLFQSIALVRMAVRMFERSPHSYAHEGSGWRPLLLLEEAAACLAEL